MDSHSNPGSDKEGERRADEQYEKYEDYLIGSYLSKIVRPDLIDTACLLPVSCLIKVQRS